MLGSGDCWIFVPIIEDLGCHSKTTWIWIAQASPKPLRRPERRTFARRPGFLTVGLKHSQSLINSYICNSTGGSFGVSSYCVKNWLILVFICDHKWDTICSFYIPRSSRKLFCSSPLQKLYSSCPLPHSRLMASLLFRWENRISQKMTTSSFHHQLHLYR